MAASKTNFEQKCNANNSPFCIGDIVCIHNLESRPHLNGVEARIIGTYNSKNQRYPIQLLSNSTEKGYVKIENLTKSSNEHQNKTRANVSRYFALKIMKSQQNLFDSELLKDIEMFKRNCIYIRKFYDTQKSQLIFNKLQNELSKKINTGEISIKKNDQMVFYSKNIKKSKSNNVNNKLGQNMYHNRYFSDTFKLIVNDLCSYFDVNHYVLLLNYYKDGNTQIAFHSDGLNHGYCNITIGISFGYERNLTFRHNKSLQQFDIPQKSGDIFAFNSKVNNKFKHGVLRVRVRKHLVKPRFSIIIFGSRIKMHARNCSDGEKMFYNALK